MNQEVFGKVRAQCIWANVGQFHGSVAAEFRHIITRPSLTGLKFMELHENHGGRVNQASRTSTIIELKPVYTIVKD